MGLVQAGRNGGRRRALGQNFLIDPEVVARTVAAADIAPGDAVLEIGPGQGILTRGLLDAGARVHAVEIDPSLADALAREAPPGLTVLEADFLKLDLEILPDRPHCVVANLPYASGTAIVERLLTLPARFPRIVVMLQKEVAQRLAAGPGSRSYGSLSVLTALWARAALVLDVPPRCFRPRPKVDSAVVRLDVSVRPRVAVPDPKLFREVVHAAFAQRRKMLRNTLRAAFGDAGIVALDRAEIDGRRRAETVTLEEFATLSREVGALA